MKTSVVRQFSDWLLEGAVADDVVDRDDFGVWLKPNFQSFADGDNYRVNPNGVALADLVALLNRASEETAAPERPTRRARRILLVSYYTPTFSHAGGLRLRDLYGEIKRLSPDIKLDLYCPRDHQVDGDTGDLGEIFDEIFYTTPADFSFGDFLLKAGSGRRYDLADFQFHQAGRLIPHFSGVASRTLFTPMECVSRSVFEQARKRLKDEHHVRLGEVFSLIHSTLDEIKICATADETVCVSDADANFMHKLVPWRGVDFISTGLSEYEFASQLSETFGLPAPSSKPKRLVFAAYFGSETNVAGLNWFLDHVHPHILRHCPDYKLLVVGRGDTSSFAARGLPNVTLIGEVPVMAPVFEQARAGLVLALHGSGFRGKINQYAICGLPAVSTSLGLTGLCYKPGVDILAADNPAEFALACVRVLMDDKHADDIGARARATALANYRWSASHEKIRRLYCL